MKNIGIIGAMAEETALIRKHLKNEKVEQVINLTFYQGNFENATITLVQSGIGKVNSSIAATLLVERFNCDMIINTGSAGAINDKLQVGDIVIANQLAYNDADSQVFGYDFGQIPQMPKYYPTAELLRNTFVKVAENTNLQTTVGEIVSGDSFISSEETKKQIINHFPDALVTEMEGAAIAQTAYQFDVPVIVIRSVSDTADGEAEKSFDEFIVEAGKSSGRMVLEAIKLL